MNRKAKRPDPPMLNGCPIDTRTGEIVDLERLQPYMEKAGYLPALAFRLLREDTE